MLKKWLLLLLALVCLPLCALALPQTPYDPATMLYYPLLTPAQQAVFDVVYAGAMRGDATVELPADTSFDDASLVMEALMHDCPELCALQSRYTVSYYQHEPEVATAVTLKYDLPASAQQQIAAEAYRIARDAGGDEFHRELYLHDVLLERVTYDLSAPQQHNAWGALMDGRAVCDGYANAMTLLLRFAGIRSGVVSGSSVATGENHAWVMACIDGSFTLVDPTNDDQEIVTRYHFNLTDEWMSRSYVPRYLLPLPACTDETVNWYVRAGCFVPPGDEETYVFAALSHVTLTGGAAALRFADEDGFNRVLEDFSGIRSRYNSAAPAGEESYGTVNLRYDRAQRCLTISP